MITAGPTREHLDDVRYLSNASSGRMGCALAEAALAAGHCVTVVHGPTEVAMPAGAECCSVTSALEMQAAAEDVFATSDIVIAAAAVADWRPAVRASGKPPRPAGPIQLELAPNPDIVKGLAERKGGRIVVGFALESVCAGMSAAIERGRRKVAAKGLDAVVVNLHDAIGSDEADFVFCFADGREDPLQRCSKAQVAARIVAAAEEMWQAKASRSRGAQPVEDQSK
ncbi:MAG: phosphopantothenoylcysteine decarboxylase [Planctomycetota bacterium]|nr:phosphopantothenoylcysteine decarboxylase [Planctomycetota bacterium]